MCDALEERDVRTCAGVVVEPLVVEADEAVQVKKLGCG